MISAGKHVTGVIKESLGQVQARENEELVPCKGRKTRKPVASAGKYEIGVKRGKNA